MDSVAQSLPDPANTNEASSQLALIHATTKRGRAVAAAVWFPLLVGGIVTLAAPSVISLIGGVAAPAWYWAFAGPAIGIACGVFYATRPVQLPASFAPASTATAVAIVAGALGLGVVLSGDARTAAPFLVVGVGFAVFAQLYRSALVLVVALCNVAAGAVLFAVGSDRVEQLVYVVCGAVACAAAVVALLRVVDAADPAAGRSPRDG